MLMKKMISVVCAAVMAASLFVMPVTADDELEPIACAQSAAFTNNGANFVLNTKDTESPQNISWNTTSGEWKGVGVLEFDLPAIEGEYDKISRAYLHNPQRLFTQRRKNIQYVRLGYCD